MIDAFWGRSFMSIEVIWNMIGDLEHGGLRIPSALEAVLRVGSEEGSACFMRD